MIREQMRFVSASVRSSRLGSGLRSLCWYMHSLLQGGGYGTCIRKLDWNHRSVIINKVSVASIAVIARRCQPEWAWSKYGRIGVKLIHSYEYVRVSGVQ